MGQGASTSAAGPDAAQAHRDLEARKTTGAASSFPSYSVKPLPLQRSGVSARFRRSKSGVTIALYDLAIRPPIAMHQVPRKCEIQIRPGPVTFRR
jgi:hypothetical protein